MVTLSRRGRAQRSIEGRGHSQWGDEDTVKVACPVQATEPGREQGRKEAAGPPPPDAGTRPHSCDSLAGSIALNLPQPLVSLLTGGNPRTKPAVRGRGGPRSAKPARVQTAWLLGRKENEGERETERETTGVWGEERHKRTCGTTAAGGPCLGSRVKQAINE